jgi:hypothetical protein
MREVRTPAYRLFDLMTSVRYLPFFLSFFSTIPLDFIFKAAVEVEVANFVNARTKKRILNERWYNTYSTTCPHSMYTRAEMVLIIEVLTT